MEKKNGKTKCWKIKFMASLAILAALTVGCSVGEPAESDTALQIVCVRSGEQTGSGVIYQKNGELLVIVTAAHVLAQGQTDGEVQAEITFYDGFTVQGTSCHVSYSSDLAFVNVPLSVMPDDQLQKYTPVKVDKSAFDALQSGAEVGLAGALELMQEDSTEGSLLESWIYVEDFGQYMMLIKGNIYPGMSGGGVFDEKKNFLGILCGINERGEVAALPLSIIEAEYAGAY